MEIKKSQKDLIVIIIGRILQIIISIITIRLMTEYLSPVEFGRLGIITGILMFIALVCINSIWMYFNRHLLSWDEKGLIKQYLYYFTIYVTIIAILANILIVIIFNNIELNLHIGYLWLAVIVFAYIVFNMLNQVIIISFNLLGYRLYFIIFMLATSITTILFSILLITYYLPIMEIWISGQILGFAILAILGWFFLSKIITTDGFSFKLPKVSKQMLYPILGFVIPLSLSDGFYWFHYQSFRFFFSDSKEGLIALGLFLAGYGLSTAILTAYETIINQYYLPIFYKNITNKTTAEQSQAWTKYAMLHIPILVITIFLVISIAPYITKLLLAETYQSAYIYVIWGIIIEGLRVLSNCISMGAHAIKNTNILLLPNLLGASIAITMITILKSYFKLDLVVGISLIISGVTLVIFLYFYINRIIQLLIDMSFIFYAFLGIVPISVMYWLSDIIHYQPSITTSVIILCISGIYYLFISGYIFFLWNKKYN